jgi:hypothetical protein
MHPANHSPSGPRRVWIAVIAAGMLGACSRETGGSLSVAVDSERLAPSSTEADAANTCCCHVRGFVRNTSDIPVYVKLTWQATRVDNQPAGPAIDTIRRLAPGERKAFTGVGIFEPCSRIARVQRTEDVRGIFVIDEGN